MQPRHNTTIRLFKVMLASTIVVPATLFAYTAFTTYRSSFSLADERIQRSLDAVGEHAAKVFQALNVTVTAVEVVIENMTDDTIRVREGELHRQLKELVSELTAVQGIWIFDRTGRPLVTSYASPVPTDLDVSDRDYFKGHIPGDIGTYVGEVSIPRIADQPFFAVSRRRTAADGSFAGAIVMSVLPADFHRFYQQLAKQKGSNYTMVRADGVVLARYPGPVIPNVRLDANSGFVRNIAQNPEASFYTTISQVDRSERRIAIRKLNGLPLYISSGLGTADIRDEWWDFLQSYLIFGVPATIMLFCLVWLTLRRTEELYAESALRIAAEENLRQSQKMETIGQLTGGVAHDFNNLLTIIIGNIEMALRKAEGGPLERMLRNALTGGQRAAQLTQKLLAFSRRQPLNPKPLDANRLVAGMADLLKRTLGEQIKIETFSAADLWHVEADASELESAILNLAINARDAMPGGGTLTIETHNTFLDEDSVRELGDVVFGQYVLISVTDTGQGMTPDILERAFEPFFTTKEGGQGTGLGLSQVYGFVKQSGGHIKIYSTAGYGTTVRMYLPRHEGTEAPLQPGHAEVKEEARGETILVVEDDQGVRSYVGEVLRELGYEVLLAESAQKALPIVEERATTIDLLLTDVVLPGMNGRELADAALKARPALPVLFMTGYSRDAIVHHGRLDPGVALIQKPLSRDALALKIRQVLDGQNSLPDSAAGGIFTSPNER
ncbi:MAG: ATP-binding protein [Pseudorhodoplanes sp.]